MLLNRHDSSMLVFPSAGEEQQDEVSQPQATSDSQLTPTMDQSGISEALSDDQPTPMDQSETPEAPSDGLPPPEDHPTLESTQTSQENEQLNTESPELENNERATP